MATQFLPGFLLGLVSCWHTGIFKTFLSHPSILLMPTFTHYTFASNRQWCRGRNNRKESREKEGTDEGEKVKHKNSTSEGTKEPYITFSAKATLVNIIMSIIGNATYGLSVTSIIIQKRFPYSRLYYFYNPEYSLLLILVPVLGLLFTFLSLPLISRSPRYLSVAKYIIANLVFNTVAYVVFLPVVVMTYWDAEKMQVFFLPIPIISLLLTLLLVILNRYCAVSLPNCCTDFFNLPKVEYGALVPSDLLSHYVLNAEGKPELVPEIEEVELEDIRSKEPVGKTNKSCNEEPEEACDKIATRL